MTTVQKIAGVEAIIQRNKRDAYRAERTAARCRSRLLGSFTHSQLARFQKMEQAESLAAGYHANVKTYVIVQAELMGELKAEAGK